MWLNFDVWLPTVLLKPIWRKRCVIVSSVVCAGEYSEATTIRSRPDARSGGGNSTEHGGCSQECSGTQRSGTACETVREAVARRG